MVCFASIIRLEFCYKKRKMAKRNAAYMSCHVSQYAVDALKVKFKCQPKNGLNN